jgi:hypothetical protein
MALAAMVAAGCWAGWPVQAQSESPRADTLIRAAVRRILGPRAFTLEYRAGVEGELVVVVPNAEATPVPGTTVIVSGVIQPFVEKELESTGGWGEIDERTRETLKGRPVLVAWSLRTAAGRQLVAELPPPGAGTRAVQQPAAAGDAMRTRVNPGALAELVDELGGREVRLPRAHVLVVLNPRAFLVESASSLRPMMGNLDRVLVLVERGELRVNPATLVGWNVTVLGKARTLLGLQVTREVPWPPELTREVLERFEIRAAVLASSVQTADAVELTGER